MYLGYYNVNPNYKSIYRYQWFHEMVWKKYENKIIKQHYRQDYDSDNKELETMDHFSFLEQEW
jgi:hypothetical protein